MDLVTKAKWDRAAANFDLIVVIIFSIFFGAFLLPLTGER